MFSYRSLWVPLLVLVLVFSAISVVAQSVDGEWAVYRVSFDLASGDEYARGSVVFNATFTDYDGYILLQVNDARIESLDANIEDLENVSAIELAEQFVYMMPYWMDPANLTDNNGVFENSTFGANLRSEYDTSTGILKHTRIEFHGNVSGYIEISLQQTSVEMGSSPAQPTQPATEQPPTTTTSSESSSSSSGSGGGVLPQTTTTSSSVSSGSPAAPGQGSETGTIGPGLLGGLGNMLWYIIAGVIVVAVVVVVVVVLVRRGRKPRYGAPLPPPPPPSY